MCSRHGYVFSQTPEKALLFGNVQNFVMNACMLSGAACSSSFSLPHVVQASACRM